MLQPKQLMAMAAARECDKEDGPTQIGFGGARGGAKSFWGLCQVANDDCQRFAGLKCLILRKVGKSGREAIEDLRHRVLGKQKHVFRRASGNMEFPNGSRIILGHFASESDIDKYLGLEYDVILVEEATTLTESKIDDIGTCLRTSKKGWRPRMYLTTNPGNIGHGWFKKRFILPYRAKKQTDTRFIPATIRDNKFVNKEYEKKLKALTGWKRKAWLDGDWDVQAGQYFSTFKELHICDWIKTTDEGILRQMEYICGFDYGFTHNTVCVLIGIDGDGIYHVFDEHVENKQMPSYHSRKIKQMLARHGLAITDIESFEAGGDVFSKDSKGQTIAKDYEKEGIKLKRANNDRIMGAQAILTLLGNPDDQEISPVRLRIHPRCARFIECLSDLTHNPKKPEDVLKVDCNEDGEGGDDAYDGGRYGIMKRFSRGTTSVGHMHGSS